VNELIVPLLVQFMNELIVPVLVQFVNELIVPRLVQFKLLIFKLKDQTEVVI